MFETVQTYKTTSTSLTGHTIESSLYYSTHWIQIWLFHRTSFSWFDNKVETILILSFQESENKLNLCFQVGTY